MTETEIVNECRACCSDELEPILSLGNQYVTNFKMARPLASHPDWIRATASSVGHHKFRILRLIAFWLGLLAGFILFLIPQIEIIGLKYHPALV